MARPRPRRRTRSVRGNGHRGYGVSATVRRSRGVGRGSQDHRDLIDDHLLDQPELDHPAADLTGGNLPDPVANEVACGGRRWSIMTVVA
jgi:hypothetical protein